MYIITINQQMSTGVIVTLSQQSLLSMTSIYCKERAKIALFIEHLLVKKTLPASTFQVLIKTSEQVLLCAVKVVMAQVMHFEPSVCMHLWWWKPSTALGTVLEPGLTFTGSRVFVQGAFVFGDTGHNKWHEVAVFTEMTVNIIKTYTCGTFGS